MKELVFNSFYFGRVWWSWRNSFWTVSTFRGCGGHERTNFEQFLIWDGVVEGCGDVVVLKELIMNSFYFLRVWWSWKDWFWTVSTFRRCGGHERTGFQPFLFWEVVMVLKELIFNSFYFGRVWWSWKNWFGTVSTFRGCSSRVWWCGGLERTDSEQFLLSEGVVVLKELILNSFYFQRVWWSWKNWFGTLSTFRGCDGLERTHFEQFLLSECVVVLKELILNSSTFTGAVVGSGGLERTDFEQFLLWEGLVGMKELILNTFYFQRVW